LTIIIKKQLIIEVNEDWIGEKQKKTKAYQDPGFFGYF